jgi:hypothetical protein
MLFSGAWGKLIPLVVGGAIVYGGLQADILGLKSIDGGLPGRVYVMSQRQIDLDARISRIEQALPLVLERLTRMESKIDNGQYNNSVLLKELQDMRRDLVGRIR